MRNLTIKREKSFVGCAMSAFIFIEDENSKDEVIKGIPCRRLGSINNNREETFSIPNDEVRIFAIFDSLSKNFCNDMVIVKEGTDDVVLSGKCKFSPFKGNPFKFNKED